MTNFNESKLSQILARAIIAPADRSQFLPLSSPIYCPSNNGVRASRVTIIVPNPVVNPNATHSVETGTSPSDTTTYSDKDFTVGGKTTQVMTTENGIADDSYYTYANVDNTVDIDINQPLNLTYRIPHEVDLETDVNLQNLIKSDFAVRFKKAISDAIHADIVLNIADITELAMGDTLAATLGNIIADNAYNGTGQRYSIYKYDNGAPAPYITASNQPDYDDKVIGETAEKTYTGYNEVGYPALYYYNLPTVLFPYTTYQEYQQGLVDGTIKRYVESKLNVDATAKDFTDIGEGVVGSNDTYAVAYNEPKITIAPDTKAYANYLCISANYGVKLINKANLRKLT